MLVPPYWPPPVSRRITTSPFLATRLEMFFRPTLLTMSTLRDVWVSTSLAQTVCGGSELMWCRSLSSTWFQSRGHLVLNCFPEWSHLSSQFFIFFLHIFPFLFSPECPYRQNSHAYQSFSRTLLNVLTIAWGYVSSYQYVPHRSVLCPTVMWTRFMLTLAWARFPLIFEIMHSQVLRCISGQH